MAVHLRSGARLEILPSIDSTSAEAARRIEAGETGPLWITATEQLEGYGRRGTPWAHAPGDLAATFIFPAGGGAAQTPELSFVAAVALKDVLDHFAPNNEFSLKWPNDIFLDGRKISGVLLELKETKAGFVVSLGLGVNLINAPAPEGRVTARLADAMTARPPEPQAVLAAFDDAFDAWRSIWGEHGFSPVRTAWLSSAYRLGERACFLPPDAKNNKTIGGVFAGIDDSGALVLETDEGVRVFAAGSLFFEAIEADDCSPNTAVRAHNQ